MASCFAENFVGWAAEIVHPSIFKKLIRHNDMVEDFDNMTWFVSADRAA